MEQGCRRGDGAKGETMFKNVATVLSMFVFRIYTLAITDPMFIAMAESKMRILFDGLHLDAALHLLLGQGKGDNLDE